jgi:leucyl aminopeptidase
VAKEVGLEIEILDPAGLKARGYQGCLRVGAGSAHPPRMVILRHVPRKASKETIALVGKGITFDTGGISLKPGDHMWEMKGDMAGAAAVLYAMRALGRIAPDVKVVGILCCAENFPDAQRPAPGRHLDGQERQVRRRRTTRTRRDASSSPTGCTARARRARPTSSTSRP